mmetsp:Transcript_8752/g.27814  ORF Transcript_8752/g.27814 Transcript_8752/m.27814 type:complete len:216 (+) Transcript_8752:455-1102(+)
MAGPRPSSHRPAAATGDAAGAGSTGGGTAPAAGWPRPDPPRACLLSNSAAGQAGRTAETKLLHGAPSRAAEGAAAASADSLRGARMPLSAVSVRPRRDARGGHRPARATAVPGTPLGHRTAPSWHPSVPGAAGPAPPRTRSTRRWRSSSALRWRTAALPGERRCGRPAGGLPRPRGARPEGGALEPLRRLSEARALRPSARPPPARGSAGSAAGS